jgi:GNAT superfamily N-acetyltransferase
MRIAEAGDADLDTVVDLRVAFLAEHRGVDRLDEDFVERTRSFLLDEHRAGTLRSWLAQVGGESIGVVSLLLRGVPPHPEHHGTVEAFAVNMYVDRGHRGRGIGRKLLDTCLQAAEETGLRRVVLHATPAGRPMYLQAGFATDDTFMARAAGAPSVEQTA